MILPNNILPELSKITGIKRDLLSGYASVKNRPGGQRALFLEDACKQMGIDVSVRLWLRGSPEEIKTALMGYKMKTVRKRTLREKIISIWRNEK